MSSRPLTFCLGSAAMILAVSAGTSSAAKLPAGEVFALKVGTEVFVRSQFSQEFDVVITLRKGGNGQVDFQSAGLVGTKVPMTAESCRQAEMIHGCQDDSAPWKLNGTFIGANHGWYGVLELTVSAHGLTTSDLGKPWTGATGERFYLARVLDADRIWVIPENEGDLERWKFQSIPPGAQLTAEGGKRTMAIEKVVKTQLLPACRIKEQQFLVDGTEPLAEGKVTPCGFLEIREDYDIINPAAVLQAVKEQAGQPVDFAGPDLDVLLTNTIRYEFQPWGACTVRHQSTVRRAFDLDYAGFVQTRVLARRPQDGLRYYIPGTLPFRSGETEYNFDRVQDFSVRPERPLVFGPAEANVETLDRLPHRFIQLLERNQTQVGYVVGYSLLEGITVPGVRARQCATPLIIHTSAKTYPAAIDKKAGRMVAGTVMECLAYRQYFDPSAISSQATACYWHRQGEIFVVHVDYHRPVEGDVLKLPDFMVGKKITAIEVSPGASIGSGETVPESGVVVSATTPRGSLIFALTDEGPALPVPPAGL